MHNRYTLYGYIANRKVCLNASKNKKIIDLSKSKAFASIRSNVVELMECVYVRVDNIEGNEETHSCHHFLLFPQCFLPFQKQLSIPKSHFILSVNALTLDQLRTFSFGTDLKHGIVWQRFNHNIDFS